jgi:hypothetical protein
MNYKYIGDGAGVPGLPHEISDEEAQAQGLSDLLMAAIANGSYVEAPPRFAKQIDPPQIQNTNLERVAKTKKE